MYTCIHSHTAYPHKPIHMHPCTQSFSHRLTPHIASTAFSCAVFNRPSRFPKNFSSAAIMATEGELAGRPMCACNMQRNLAVMTVDSSQTQACAIQHGVGYFRGNVTAVCKYDRAVLKSFLKEWKYVEGFNVCFATIIVIMLGWLSVRLKVTEQSQTATINKFIFKVALPCHILRGIGFKTDFYDPEMWKFVAMFLVLRVIYLVAVIIIVGFIQKGTIGDVAATWLASTWISTVIHGVPIIRSACTCCFLILINFHPSFPSSIYPGLHIRL